ncbi:MAG: antitoxin [Nitrospinae bacterium RIFCSPLOWO2_01_FULL_39_10]|nr:MAG: antitoxin [Nitrospinae bacterium RIFCSPLOWO2_01_FULL_39_10]
MGDINMKERIEVNPEIHFGKPCIAGTRIPVQSVLELVREGLSFTEIIQDYYPELQIEDIQACIEYAIDVVASEEIHISVPT